MLEGRGDNFNDVSTDRLKLELQEEMHLKVRCNSVNQKTMNAMRGPVKKISRSSRLSKFNL
ncbi:TPA: hypothetical protein BOS_12445 [Bos taurus]|nr:TPA: hypothetical protein BOS_12445 [Bos taurus]